MAIDFSKTTKIESKAMQLVDNKKKIVEYFGKRGIKSRIHNDHVIVSRPLFGECLKRVEYIGDEDTVIRSFNDANDYYKRTYVDKMLKFN